MHTGARRAARSELVFIAVAAVRPREACFAGALAIATPAIVAALGVGRVTAAAAPAILAKLVCDAVLAVGTRPVCLARSFDAFTVPFLAAVAGSVLTGARRVTVRPKHGGVRAMVAVDTHKAGGARTRQAVAGRRRRVAVWPAVLTLAIVLWFTRWSKVPRQARVALGALPVWLAGTPAVAVDTRTAFHRASVVAVARVRAVISPRLWVLAVIAVVACPATRAAARNTVTGVLVDHHAIIAGAELRALADLSARRAKVCRLQA